MSTSKISTSSSSPLATQAATSRPHSDAPPGHRTVLPHNSARQNSIALVFGIVPSSVSTAIWLGLAALKAMMDQDEAWAIKWPTPDTMRDMAAAVHAREPLLKHVFGFVDGLNLRIYQPGDLDEQNAYYNGWLGDTYCSQVLVFLPNGEIAWASFNYPGSWHDAKISAGLYTLLNDPQRTPASYAILADSAFPYNKELAGRILSKPKDAIADKEKDGSKHLMWEAIIRQRQAAEWGMRALQGAFGRLDLRLSTHKVKRALLLSVIFRLHNFRARHVGLKQIKEVYFPQWQDRSSCKLVLQWLRLALLETLLDCSSVVSRRNLVPAWSLCK
ncbi:hypothetical protein A4X13_0g6610 [Tilletia indica]|uniref:DDE Tnp4 domain-containing protein n=1 Tax=Tilletia indica TaxID=43049 RepID=A0A8T8SNC2_9BASI|nr:hypothetical protein A4X13_0g6610 [Tilletia indica]